MKDFKQEAKEWAEKIGVPMSALLAEKQHQFGIFEAGISQKGEMKKISILKAMITGLLLAVAPTLAVAQATVTGTYDCAIASANRTLNPVANVTGMNGLTCPPVVPRS
jgi:hypothetical protein